MQGLSLILSTCFFIFSCNAQKKIESIKYYSDFHIVNVAGINELKEDDIKYPYVKIITYNDSSKEVIFYLSTLKKYSKKYQYKNGMLISIHKLNIKDTGCDYFTEVQYYFSKGKMITYVFCENADMKNKTRVYKVYCEDLSSPDSLYYYKLKSCVLTSFEKKTEALITFNPFIDYNGPFFTEVGVLLNESTFYNEGSKLREISKSYLTKSDGTKSYIKNIDYLSPIRKGTISIWKNLDIYKGF